MYRLFNVLFLWIGMAAISNGQQISFIGRDVITGSTVELDSVYIKNLTTGRDTTIFGGQSINLLPLTDINESNSSLQSSYMVYQNYPNPFTYSTTIMVSSPVRDEAKVKVYDILGKLHYSGQVYLSEGDNQITFHPGSLASGIYFLTMTTLKGSISVKMMKLSESGAGQPTIDYQGQSIDKRTGLSKSAAVVPVYMFIGFAANYTDNRLNNITAENGKIYQFDMTPLTCAVTDIDGNVYKAVKIGNQLWMAENLKVTHYRNGDEIPNVTDDSVWAGLNDGALCVYNNNEANIAKYGRLYNWYAVNDSRGLAPEGWHIPSQEEFETLLNYCGGEGNPAYKALISGGSSGFSSLFGGFRGHQGFFYGLGSSIQNRPSSLFRICESIRLIASWQYYACYWSSLSSNEYNARSLSLSKDSKGADMHGSFKVFGLSIRCVKD